MVQLEEFGALGLTDVTLEAIKAKGFETPSPIQKLTIPVLLDDEKTNDIIAQAQTGTGKTAAFGLPILERLRPQKGATQALILVPTRELALQVTEEILSFNAKRKLVISPIYGGASMTEQLRRLGKGIDVVVGTPGRILDHLRRGTLDIKALKYLILDEADEMLNMGFIEDVEEILSNTNDYRRILLFSATMPERIIRLSKKYMRDVEILRVPAQEVTTELTDQIYFEVRDSDKFDALTRIIDVEPEFYGIVFCRTKIGVDEVVNKLTERGYAAEGLHGDVSQVQREKILKRFKKKLANILVATDVAARGIDINNLTHVINYSLPQDTESYVHRIGRTGRAGNTGTAITFISHSEYRQFSSLKREIKVDIKKVALPSAQDVVEIKKTKIKDDLIEIVESESYRKYTEMAGEVLQNLDPEVALAALLKLAFKNELEESSYPEIRSINVDRKGTARLFISIGKMDGFDARKLTDMLKRECRLPDNKIDDVRVMDSYSFVTVPFSDARQAIRQLNDINRGGRPIAELAKDGDSGENRERSGRDFRKEKRKGARKEDRKTERRDAARKSGGNPRKNDFDWNNVQWDAVNPAAGWGGKAGFDKRAGGKKRGKR
ncbi:DEAD/DEAH box helicase [Alistipes sp. dk3620]|uniref:DEAD/DEAH box helicase n=1 Tax=unclassified Alistipes TaxID=2608932 RepID=UPI000E4D31C3|nr:MULTISPECIES: DEAD/DEAH box helicase [unclassified Alistipes]MQX27650.1 DEAD/DEAH box helicase [Alistipes sp. dk3620]QGA23161.1 DEAD/DEAH box helicase [Alistipes sp. dk3624]RHO68709.1 ATP-dependent helicase [Alistipes sp. AF48-12]